MNVKALRALLDNYPDDMEVAVIDNTYGGDDLDTEPNSDVAINHPGSRHDGRHSWHWKDKAGPDGEAVLVFY